MGVGPGPGRPSPSSSRRPSRTRSRSDARDRLGPGPPLETPIAAHPAWLRTAAAVPAGGRAWRGPPRQRPPRTAAKPARPWPHSDLDDAPDQPCPVGRTRPPRRLGAGGGGAAGRSGGQRRGRRAGAGVGPARPGSGPVELGRHDGAVGRWRCCRTVGWSAAGSTGGCWCGIRPARERPGRARPPRRLGAGGGGAAGRSGGQRRRRRAGAGVGSGPAREPTGRARPPRRRG